jgi:hypothetical protein
LNGSNERLRIAFQWVLVTQVADICRTMIP